MINIEYIKTIIGSCNSFTDLAKKINYKGTTNLKRQIINNNIDFSHFYKTLENKICRKCEKEFKPKCKKQLFCSQSCSAKYNNPLKKNIKYCLDCNCIITRYGKFCKTCYLKNKEKARENLIKNGKIKSPTSLKKYISKNRGNKCEICNQLPLHNNLPLVLQLDHKDGDSDNNKLDNLRLICPNCHTQTDTFTSRNRKNTKRNKYNRLYRKRIQQSQY